MCGAIPGQIYEVFKVGESEISYDVNTRIILTVPSYLCAKIKKKQKKKQYYNTDNLVNLSF